MDINEQLSPSYKVRDLIQTTYSVDNTPTDAYLPNLTALAQLLEYLKTIDDFRIESGFRTPALNALVKGADNSYHSEGLAADIVPKNLSAREFWMRIHNDPAFYNSVGEYALKEDRNTPNVHVSCPTPTKVAFDLIETSPGVYVRSGIARNEAYTDPEEQQSESSYSIEPTSPSPVMLAALVGAGLLVLALSLSRRTA
jgi:hypothetical protein